MAKKGDQKDITVNGEGYVLQHPGNMWILKNQDSAKNRFGVVQEAELVKSIFENVVIKPQKVDLDELEFSSIKEILEEAKSFLGIN